MTEEPAPKEWGDWLFVCGFGMQNLLLSRVGELPKRFPDTAQHLKFNWNKLRMFLLPEGEYLFLDVDFLCMRDAQAILDTPSISAACEKPGIVGHKESQQPLRNRINAGLIRFDASRWFYDKCSDVIKMSIAKNYTVGLAEQTIINTVLEMNAKDPRARLRHLGDKWNMPAFLATRNPKLWKPDEAIFIHYTGQCKPWTGWDARRDVREMDHHCPPLPRTPIDIWRDYAKQISA
jgi:hypothetical protein